MGSVWLGVSLGLLVASGALAGDNPPPAVRPRGRRDAANTPTALSRGTTTSAPVAPPPPAPAVVAPTREPTAAAPRGSEFNSCKKVPAGKRVVRLKLKPETNLGDLVAWISSITCKAFLLPGTIPSDSKKVTIVAPGVMTPEEAYGLFLSTLESVGLTVEPSDWFLRIIETSKAHSSAVPLIVDTNVR